jgi:hypothetical protein
VLAPGERPERGGRRGDPQLRPFQREDHQRQFVEQPLDERGLADPWRKPVNVLRLDHDQAFLLTTPGNSRCTTAPRASQVLVRAHSGVSAAV